MRNLIILSLLLASAFYASDARAQTGSARVRNKLSVPAVGGARVVVTERGDAQDAVRELESARRTPSKINGYRIRIFFDNKQNARGSANAAKNRFEEMFPDVTAQLSYENPYWKVTVGNCLTNEEAIILWGRVKAAFDRAFVVREDISLASLAELPKEEESTARQSE